jgi:uncharacterized membrane protein YvbJ
MNLANCTNCGNPLKNRANFCTQCGMEASNDETYKSRFARKNLKKKISWSKNQKIWTLGVVGAILALSIIYFTINHIVNIDRMISEFEEAIIDQDASKLASLISSGSEELEVNDQTVTPLMTWLSNNPKDLAAAMNQLREQAKTIEQNGDLPDKEAEGKIVNLKKGSKLFGLFDRYSLEVLPAYVELTAPYEDTVFMYGKEELGKKKEQTGVIKAGPYIPGNHKFRAKLVTEYVDLEKTVEAELKPGQDNEVSFDFDADEVNILTDLGSLNTEVELLVNNESIKWELPSDKPFGPVLLDGSMNMALKFEFLWGEITTEEVPVDQKSLFFNIKQEKEVKKLVADLSEIAFTNYLEAKSGQKQIEALNNFTNNGKASLKRLIQANQGTAEWRHRKPLHYEIFPTSTTFDQEKDIFKMSSTVRLTEEVEFADWVEEVSTLYKLQFLYDTQDEKWKIELMEQSNTFLSEEPEEHTFNKETVYENTNYKEELQPEFISAVENFYREYVNRLTAAINQGNFNFVKNYLKRDSDLYNSQKQLIKKLNKQGIKEQVYDLKISNMRREGDIVTFQAHEKIYIFYANRQTELKEYNWTYTVEIMNGKLKLTSIR